MSRPEVLFPLFAELTALDGVGPKTARLLARLDVAHPVHLILTLPTGGIDRRLRASVREAQPPEVVTVEVEVGLHQPGGSRTRPYRVHVRDALTEFQLVFFHARDDWLRRMLPAGQRRIVSGRVELFDGIAQMVHPDHILRPGEDLPAYEPVYPLTEGLTLRDHDPRGPGRPRARPRPPGVDRAEPQAPPRMAGLGRGARRCRTPPTARPTSSPAAPARERLAYDELLAHQVTLALARARMPPRQGLRHRRRRPAARPGARRPALRADRRPGPRRRRDHRRHGRSPAG